MNDALRPLDAEGILWLAAIDRVPIEERIEWVKTMLGRVEQINEIRASLRSVQGAQKEQRES